MKKTLDRLNITGFLKSLIVAILLFSGISVKAEKPLTLWNFAKELIHQDIDHWKVVMAQGILESGWEFNSNLYKQTNNFVGMRIPGRRPSTRMGEYRGYSQYRKWQDCVTDIRYWQNQNWRGGTQEEYINFVSRIWAEDPMYKKNLLIIMRRIDRMLEKLKENKKDHFNYLIISAYDLQN